MIDVIETIGQNFVIKSVELGNFTSFKVKPMRVTVKRWQVEELGGLTMMDSRAAFGLMNMKTLVFTPGYRDLPLFSYDLISVMGKNTLLIEYYDFPVSDSQPDYYRQRELRNSLQGMKKYNIPSGWMDDYLISELTVAVKGGKRVLPAMEKAMEQSLVDYLQIANQAYPLTNDESHQKRMLIEEYVDKLFALGSPTTNVFLKAMSEEKAKEFYKNVMFCP